MEDINIDEINDIMTEFLENVVKVAKIHTDYKEKLGENHEYTVFSCTMVKIFNQYQQLYVYVNNQEEYAHRLVELSNLVLKVLEYTPYELKEGSFFKKRKKIKEEKPLREEAINKTKEAIEAINSIIDIDMNKEELLKNESEEETSN